MFEYNCTHMFRGQFYSRSNPLEQEPAWIGRVLSAIDAALGAFAASGVAGGSARSYRYTHERAAELLEKQSGAKWLGLERPADPFLLVSLDFIARPPAKLPYGFKIEVKTPLKPADDADADALAAAVMNVLRAVSQCCPALYGWAHSDPDVALGKELKSFDLAAPKLNEIYWLNILGADLVEWIGRERVLATPAAKLEALPDGAILLMSHASPWTFAEPEARQAQARALAHLRPDLDEATILARLLAQSETLAPVEPMWDPDVAELLTRILDYRYAYWERMPKIKELNARQQPPVTEHRALEPEDLNDPLDLEAMAEAKTRFGHLSERLIALLHSDVPELMKGGSSGLANLDYDFWLRRRVLAWGPKLSEEAAEMLGAYLGTALRRDFGGFWLPAETLDETAIAVGGRAWLPFKRAKAFVQSPEAAIDYSLSQFYNAVKRHVEQAGA